MKWLKANKLLSIGIALPFLLVVLYNTPFVQNYTQKVIGEKLVALALKSSNQIKTIHYSDIHFSLVTSQLSLNKLEVSFHAPIHDTLFNSFSASNLKLNINGLWKIYFQQSLEIEGLVIHQPVVQLHKKLNANEKTTVTLQTGDLYQSISKILKELAIATFELTNGHFTFLLHAVDGTSTIAINDISMWITDFELNNKSKKRDDKFFYTEDIKIKLGGQSVYLPDSIHTVHFDSLLLSTVDESFLIHGFRIVAKEDDSKTVNLYNLHIPLLNITNVDFTKAYNHHELEIEKILFEGGTITVDNQKNLIQNRNPDLLAQLNEVFGKLEIKELALVNTNLTINAHPIGLEKKFNLTQLDLSIFEINLDHNNTDIDFENRYFKDLEVRLKSHFFELPEHNHRLQIKDLHISTKRKLFAAGNIELQPILNNNELGSLNEIEIENLVVEGFDPYEYVNDRKLLLKLMTVQQLSIKTIPKPTAQQAGVQPVKSLENLFPYIQPYLDKVKIDSLFFQNINLNLATKSGPFLIEGGSLQIKLFDLDSTTHLDPENIFHLRNFIAFATKATLPLKNQLIKIDSLYLNKDLSLITTKTIQFSKNNKLSKSGMNGTIAEVYFKGLKLRQILYQQRYLFDSLIIKHPVLEIHEQPGSISGKKSKTNISDFIAEFEIGMIGIKEGEISYQEGELEILSIDNFNAHLVNAALSTPNLLRDELLVKYEDFRVQFNDLYYSTPEFRHILQIQSCQLHLKDSTGTIQNIRLNPIIEEDSLTLFTVAIPTITFKGINDYNSYFNKKTDISSLHIYNPSIKVTAGNTKTKSMKGFPTLKSGMFLLEWDSLGIDDFQIINGALGFQKNDDRLTIEKFQVKLKDFEVFADTEMVREKFLFSKEVDINLSSTQYFNSTTKDSIAIKTIALKSKNKNLRLNQTNFSINGKTPVMGVIPEMELMGFSFFDFTQNKQVIVDEVQLQSPEFQLSFPEKKPTLKTNRFAQLNTYPFDTYKIEAIRVGNCKVTDARILGLRDSTLSVGNIGVTLTHFILHPDSIAKHNLPFHSEKFELSVADLAYKIDPHNKIEIGLLDYNSKPSTATIQSFALVPLHDPVKYGQVIGEQASWLSIKNSKTTINNLDFEALIGNKAIHAKNIIVDDVVIDVFRDKRLPFPAHQVRELPHRDLKELPFGVKIDSLVLKKGRVEYVEQSAKVDATGSIYFDNMQASIINITNDTMRILSNPVMTAKIETEMYGVAKTVAHFDFNLADPEYGYQYTTAIGSFDLLKLNEILEPAILAKVKEGQLNSLQQVVTANDNYAQGEMIFRYDNLKVGLIKGMDDPNPGVGKALATFFANTFIVRSRNPAPFLRKSDVFYERNHSKSIFDFLVKSTLSGVVESIGARSNRKKIKQHKKEAKQQARKKYEVPTSDVE